MSDELDANDDALVFMAKDSQVENSIRGFIGELLLVVLDLRARVFSEKDSQSKRFLNTLREIEGITQFFISRTSPLENSITRGGSEISSGVGRLPFYIVCDEGSSMTNDAIAEVNVGIGELFRAIHGDPVVDAKARVGIITFNDQASVLLPLTELSQITQSPGCICSVNPSSYKNVFHLLKAQIETDVLSLEVEGFRVHRPVVFFMSSGKPKLEDWHASWEELTEKNSRFRPRIVSWGTHGADLSVIGKIATPWFSEKDFFAFSATDGVGPGAVLREIMKSTESEIIHSSPSVSFVRDTGSVGELAIDSI